MGVAGIIFSEEKMISAVVLLAVVLAVGFINWRIFQGDDTTREQSGLDIHARADKKDGEK